MDNSKPKIVYLIDYFHGKHGGTEGQLWSIIEGVDRSQFDPEMVVLQATRYLEEERELPCAVSCLYVKKLASFNMLIRMARLFFYLKSNNVKVVHIFFPDASLIGPLVAKLAGAKVVVSRRDMGFWYTPAYLWGLRFSNLFVDRIIANSNAVRINVNKFEKFDLDKIDVIYNGYNSKSYFEKKPIDIRKRYGIKPEDPIVGIVANLRPIKRHKDLISAIKIVKKCHPGVRLMIMGEGELETELKRQAEENGLKDNVLFTGSTHDVIPFIKNFSVGVLCSESEGFSNAIIEYLGCSVPVVCTNVGGNPELVQSGKNGYLVEVGDVAGLAKNINRLLSEKEIATSMRKNAKQSIANYDMEIMQNHYRGLYQNQVIA